MIDFLSSWAEQIVVAIIVTTIIELILPNNKIKKYINTIIGIYILFNIISPIINTDAISFENIEEQFNTTIENSDIVDNSSMDNRLQDIYIQEIEKNVTQKVEEEGYKVDKCKIDANLKEGENTGINKISIKISKKQGENNNENKNEISTVEKVIIKIGDKKESENFTTVEINSLKDKISKYYEIDTSKININY